MLYLVTEFLETKDMIALMMTCRELHALVEIPYIEIRILKLKISKLESVEASHHLLL